MRRFVVVLVLLGCSTDLPAPPNLVDTSAEGEMPTTTTAPSTSEGSTSATEPMVVLDVTLDLEMRDSIEVLVTTHGTAVEIAMDVSDGFGVVGGNLVGVGRIDTYPELGAMLYTATFAGPAVVDGPCGDAPVSLSLALHRKDGDPIIAGGLTAYCGADTFFGVPVIEPLRIFGRVP